MKETTVKKLPLTSDIVFKRVFAKEGNEDILKSLLEAILEISIQKLIVKNPEIPRNLYDQKASILDIKVEIDQNTICDIEIQVKDLKNIKRRSTYYMARLFSDDLKKGEDYKKIKNTIVINLLNFETYHRNSYHNIAHLKFEKTKEEEKVDMGYEQEEEIASKELEMHFIEIPKFIKKDPEAKTKLEKWLWLLAGREDKLEMAKKKDEDIKKAMDIIEEMSMDEKEWDLCRAREIAILDYNTGILEAKEEGEERGERKKQLEIAKKMLDLKISIDKIEKATGLTKKEIEEL